MRTAAAELEERLGARLRAGGSTLGSPGLAARILEKARGLDARRAVDVGSGCGGLAAGLRAQGREVVSLDLCRLARPPLVQGDAERLPLAGGRFDLVTSVLVLHYLRRPDRALQEAARVLRPGGWLLLADRIRTVRPGIERLRNPSVRRLLTPAEIVDRVRDVGFGIVDVEAWEETVPLGAWLAGVDPGRSRLIRAALPGDSITLGMRICLARKP